MVTIATSDASASGEPNAFRWQLTVGAALGGTWKAETSVGGTDEQWDSGVAGQRATHVDLAVIMSKARRPYYFFGGNLLHIGPTVTAADVVLPKIVVQAATTDAKSMGIQWMAWGQRHEIRA